MVVVWVRLPHLVQQTLLTPLTIVLLIINSPTGEASGNIMSLIKTKDGSLVEGVLLEQTPSGRIWFAADCIIATNNSDEEINATYSKVDASVIMNNLRYEIIMARKWYSIYLVTGSEERVYICRAFSEEEISDMYNALKVKNPSNIYLIVQDTPITL